MPYSTSIFAMNKLFLRKIIIVVAIEVIEFLIVEFQNACRNFIYKKRDGIKIIIAFLISGLSVVLFMVVFYGIFTSIAFRQQFALTEISKYTAIINNIGRFDYIGILNILFSGIFKKEKKNSFV